MTSVDIKSIKTFPNPLERVFAVGYSSFVATTTVQFNKSFSECRWEFGKNFGSSLYFYSNGCYFESSWQANISCLEEGHLVTSNLTILEPLENGQFNIRIVCDGGQQKTLPSITVQSKKVLCI